MMDKEITSISQEKFVRGRSMSRVSGPETKRLVPLVP